MTRSHSHTPGAHASARSTPSRRSRTAKQAKAEHRGGEWGRGVAERLRRLKGSLGVNRWAVDVLGFTSGSKVSSYLNGKRLPDAPTLRTIAERTGASLDWLLLGDGGDEPRYRGQSRADAELEADVAAHVARQVATVTASTPVAPGVSSPEHFAVDARRLLADAVTREAQALTAWLAPQLSNVERRRAIRQVAEDLHAVHTGLRMRLGENPAGALAPLLLSAKALADVSGRLLPPYSDEPAVVLSPAGVQAVAATLPPVVPNLDMVSRLAPSPTVGEINAMAPDDPRRPKWNLARLVVASIEDHRRMREVLGE